MKLINDKFISKEDDIKKLHPLDWLNIIKDIHSFLEQSIKDLKKECKTAFKWQYFKNEILTDWGQWSNKTNRILRQQIKDTEKGLPKLNKQYKYLYQYWWQTNFHLEIITMFTQHISHKKSKQIYAKNRIELEKIIKRIKKVKE